MLVFSRETDGSVSNRNAEAEDYEGHESPGGPVVVVAEFPSLFGGEQCASGRDGEPAGRFLDESGELGTLFGRQLAQGFCSENFVTASAQPQHDGWQ